MSQHEFPFPCYKHAADVLVHVVNFYLQYRMRQSVKTMMANLKKAKKSKKEENDQSWCPHNVCNNIEFLNIFHSDYK